MSIRWPGAIWRIDLRMKVARRQTLKHAVDGRQHDHRLFADTERQARQSGHPLGNDVGVRADPVVRHRIPRRDRDHPHFRCEKCQARSSGSSRRSSRATCRIVCPRPPPAAWASRNSSARTSASCPSTTPLNRSAGHRRQFGHCVHSSKSDPSLNATSRVSPARERRGYPRSAARNPDAHMHSDQAARD